MPFTHTDDDRGARVKRATMEVCITPSSTQLTLRSTPRVAALKGASVQGRVAATMSISAVLVE